MALTTDSLRKAIKKNKVKVYRSAYIKRRSSTTGLFESNWLEITKDVKKWGGIRTQIDSVRLNKFSLSNAKMVVANDTGRFNHSSHQSSLWYGYKNQQRSLVKIEAGFVLQTLASNGIWVNQFVPGQSYWDQIQWDGASWDDDAKTLFVGIISGDILNSDKNEIVLNIAPLQQVFREYSARNLSGYTSTGLTASQFMQSVRDHTVGGNYVFRPFFGDTTTNWDISTTTTLYTQLSSSGAEDIRSATVWDVMERLSESENFVSYITREGKFIFKSRTSNTTTANYHHIGVGTRDADYGNVIKSIDSYGEKISKLYTRVQVRFDSTDTNTSFETVESTLTVDGNSIAWEYGERTLAINNYWIPNTASANAIATNIFNDYSSLKREISFETSFIPHLEVLDRIKVSYDSNPINFNSLWDLGVWGDTAGGAVFSNDLYWDSLGSDAINLSAEEFNLLSQEINLDNFSCRYVARET